eukprot:Polyplicarium_translucidae@DN3131_c0_g1_i1.p1
MRLLFVVAGLLRLAFGVVEPLPGEAFNSLRRAGRLSGWAGTELRYHGWVVFKKRVLCSLRTCPTHVYITVRKSFPVARRTWRRFNDDHHRLTIRVRDSLVVTPALYDVKAEIPAEPATYLVPLPPPRNAFVHPEAGGVELPCSDRVTQSWWIMVGAASDQLTAAPQTRANWVFDQDSTSLQLGGVYPSRSECMYGCCDSNIDNGTVVAFSSRGPQGTAAINMEKKLTSSLYIPVHNLHSRHALYSTTQLRRCRSNAVKSDDCSPGWWPTGANVAESRLPYSTSNWMNATIVTGKDRHDVDWSIATQCVCLSMNSEDASLGVQLRAGILADGAIPDMTHLCVRSQYLGAERCQCAGGFDISSPAATHGVSCIPLKVHEGGNVAFAQFSPDWDTVPGAYRLDWALPRISSDGAAPQSVRTELVVAAEKGCPNDCSGRGHCRVRGTEPSWLIGHCRCDHGWGGDSCNVPTHRKSVPYLHAVLLTLSNLGILPAAVFAFRWAYPRATRDPAVAQQEYWDSCSPLTARTTGSFGSTKAEALAVSTDQTFRHKVALTLRRRFRKLIWICTDVNWSNQVFMGFFFIIICNVGIWSVLYHACDTMDVCMLPMRSGNSGRTAEEVRQDNVRHVAQVAFLGSSTVALKEAPFQFSASWAESRADALNSFLSSARGLNVLNSSAYMSTALDSVSVTTRFLDKFYSASPVIGHAGHEDGHSDSGRVSSAYARFPADDDNPSWDLMNSIQPPPLQDLRDGRQDDAKFEILQMIDFGFAYYVMNLVAIGICMFAFPTMILATIGFTAAAIYLTLIFLPTNAWYLIVSGSAGVSLIAARVLYYLLFDSPREIRRSRRDLSQELEGQVVLAFETWCASPKARRCVPESVYPCATPKGKKVSWCHRLVDRLHRIWIGLACQYHKRIQSSKRLLVAGIILVFAVGAQILASLSGDLYWLLHSLWHIGIQLTPYLVLRSVYGTPPH